VAYGFVLAKIERVGSGPDLENNRVDADCLQRVEDSYHFLFLCSGISDSLFGWPIDIGDGSNPGSVESDFGMKKPLLTSLEREEKKTN
jgi:hypothetical protein